MTLHTVLSVGYAFLAVACYVLTLACAHYTDGALAVAYSVTFSLHAVLCTSQSREMWRKRTIAGCNNTRTSLRRIRQVLQDFQHRDPDLIAEIRRALLGGD